MVNYIVLGYSYFASKKINKLEFIFRKGTINDVADLKQLALKSWGIYQTSLTDDNWKILEDSLNDDQTYTDLLNGSQCIVCANENDTLIGMAFLVNSGNPTEIYENDWSYIRFVTVHPDYYGLGLGRALTLKCIDLAIANNEKYIALHTSELMVKARHLYESLGFKIVKEIDARLGKRYWLYKLDLI